MLKIVAVAFVCACIILFLKNINSELTILVEIMSGIILVSMILPYINKTLGFFDELVALTGLNESYYKILFKAIAIGYTVEFAAGTVSDFGLKGFSDKLLLVGKLIIIGVSLPVFYAVIKLVTELG